MPEQLDEIKVKELSLVPKGAHPGTDFVTLSKDSGEDSVDEPMTPDVLAKSFIERISEIDEASLKAVASAILAKSGDEPEEDEDDKEQNAKFDKRITSMEKTLAGLTGGLAKSVELIEEMAKSITATPEKKVPEPEPEDPALAKGLEEIERLTKSIESFQEQFRSTQAKAKAALGEDPGA